MPNRVIREGILTSERVDALPSWASEVFYRRLMSVVDDFGRYFAQPSLLRAACYPLRLDKVSNADVEKWLAECAGAALVSTYEVGGKKYLQMLDFRQQIRQGTSRYPPPTSECAASATHLSAESEWPTTHTDSPSSVFSKPGEERRGKPRARARKTALPVDFGISDRVRTWATQRGFDRLEEHLDAFKRKATARGYLYVDWEAAFMEAIREDWAKIRAAARATPAGRQAGVEARNAEVVERFVNGGKS